MKSILIAAAECSPLVKTGGLADVCCVLPKAFDTDLWDVRLVLPNYSCINEKYRRNFKKVAEFSLSVGPDIQNKPVEIFETTISGVVYYLVGNQEYFDTPEPYSTYFRRDIEKFIFFDKAVLCMLKAISFQPQLIHCHDWPTAMVPVLLKKEFCKDAFYEKMRTIMTIHNLKFQGIWDIPTFKGFTGFSDDMFTDRQLEYHSNANMLKGGLLYADYITTVSRTYCSQIQTHSFGEGLDGVLASRHLDMQGIQSGIDTERYNPQTDTALFENYDASNVFEGKRKNKEALQEYLGMVKDPSRYVIGVVAKLLPQNGLELILSAMEGMIDDYTQVVVLGCGNPTYENRLRDYAWRFPDQISANIRYDSELAQRIYAGADAILIPSLCKPCGTSQMLAARYGAVPIVYEAGGLKDTVVAFDEYSDSGNGFSFRKYNSDDLLHIVNYTKQIYFDKHTLWEHMVQRGMQLDHSWKKTAGQYADLYTYIIER